MYMQMRATWDNHIMLILHANSVAHAAFVQSV